MNIFQMIRERLSAVIGVVFFSIFICICGALFTFVFGPQQALEANRISKLPQMDAGYVVAASPGSEVLVTGSLAGNSAVVEDSRFVAYILEEWDVTPGSSSEDSETEPKGSWESVENVVPNLMVNLNGQTLQILSSTTVSLSGPLHEELIPGNGVEQAQYDGNWLAEGSLRYRGFYEGDLITALGQKASTGDVIPEKLYAGDRVAFEKSEADAAKGMLFMGIAMMVCSPIFLVLGGLGAIFGRGRRTGGIRFR